MASTTESSFFLWKLPVIFPGLTDTTLTWFPFYLSSFSCSAPIVGSFSSGQWAPKRLTAGPFSILTFYYVPRDLVFALPFNYRLFTKDSEMYVSVSGLSSELQTWVYAQTSLWPRNNSRVSQIQYVLSWSQHLPPTHLPSPTGRAVTSQTWKSEWES